MNHRVGPGNWDEAPVHRVVHRRYVDGEILPGGFLWSTLWAGPGWEVEAADPLPGRNRNILDTLLETLLETVLYNILYLLLSNTLSFFLFRLCIIYYKFY